MPSSKKKLTHLQAISNLGMHCTLADIIYIYVCVRISIYIHIHMSTLNVYISVIVRPIQKYTVYIYIGRCMYVCAYVIIIYI